MSWHKENYVAASNVVLTFFKDHPVFTYVLFAYLAGAITMRFVNGC